MAVNVTLLRDRARGVLEEQGARGFVRFAAEGPLLVTDAAQRCADGGRALADGLTRAGFVCRDADGLLGLTPDGALLTRICARQARTVAIDWDSSLHPAQALAARLLRAPEAPEMTAAGRALCVETARLLWRGREQVLAGLLPLRARVAVLLRERDTTSFACAGALLANWCDEWTSSTR